MDKLPSQRNVPIDKAITMALKTIPLPISEADRDGINEILRWQHTGCTKLHINQ